MKGILNMKKLSKEQLKNISDEIINESFSNHDKESASKLMAESILIIIEKFIEKYQDKISE